MTDAVFTAFVSGGLWPGLGKTLAGQLAEHGIIGPADVLPSRLAQLPAVGLVRAGRLVEAFASAADRYQVVALLVPAGLEARMAFRVLDALGPSAAERLQSDPWRLLDVPEARLAQADRLARSLLGPQMSLADPRRGAALVVHVLVTAARDGHTCQPPELVARQVELAEYAATGDALRSALADDRVLAGADGILSLPRYARAEDVVAEGIGRLLRTASPLVTPTAATADSTLDAAQSEAVLLALQHGVSVLTGGPGTGKSRTVAALVGLARARRRQVGLAAPTGRAARRLEELCEAPAMTLHRLLGAQGTTGQFSRGADWPLDEDVIVVDEASMLDVELAAALLEACPDGCHLLFVGDPAQLPSIGAGRVLGDLIDSGVVPVTELTTLYRQEQGGAIARLATAVRGGSLPAIETDPAREVVIIAASHPAEAAHRAVQLATDSIPRVLGIPAEEVQVVTPVHRGAAGTIALNQALKRRLNPGGGEVQGFDVGDRVVATANHVDEGFANGEMGVVSGKADKGLIVSFGAGPVTVSPKSLADLRHGWAVTVHRAQGSEFAAVVAVLPPEAGGLLSRPLVYTAFTRAQRHLSVVHAVGPALARAVREVGALPRRTRLAILLRDLPPAG